MKYTYAEYFLGIGAPGKAIKRVTSRHNDICEFKYGFENDKYARNAYVAIHDEDESKIYWDIREQPKELPYVDIVFYSPPCQTFSIAGKKEGTTVNKGKLFYNALKGIKKSRPKYAIMENVANLKNQFRKDFNAMVQALEEVGYMNYAKVLNSKDYGIPQNRPRIFVVSIRKDIYDQGVRFEFPKPIKLEKRLVDVLEPVVSKDYLLSKKMIKCLLREGTSFDGRNTDNFIYVKSNTKNGYELAYPGDSVNIEFPGSNTRRGRVGKGVSQTLTTSMGIAYYNGYCLRSLTVKEGFRLQGFDDEDYHKAVKSYNETFLNGKSSTQMKIKLGNSITVQVEEEILENLLYQRKQIGNQISLI